MKIEVTFRKTTKETFKKQCIKKLQGFVEHLKQPKETSSERKPVQQKYLQGQYQRAKVQKKIKNPQQTPQRSRASSIDEMNTTVKKGGVLAESEVVSYPKQAKRKELWSHSQNNPQKENCNMPLLEMRQQVDKILHRFGRQISQNQGNFFELAEKVQKMDKKLDYLLNCSDQKKSSSEAQTFSDEHLLLNSSFDDKFEALVGRFEAVKSRSRPHKNRLQRQVTPDWLTFRKM